MPLSVCWKSGELALPLLVFGIGTDHHDSTATTNNAALFTNFFDGCSNFHVVVSNTTNFILY